MAYGIETPTLPLAKEQVTEWQTRIEQSEKRRESMRDGWTGNVTAFEGKPFKADPKVDTIVVNKDWPMVKQKISQLFFRVPEVQLTPRREDAKSVAPLATGALNFTLTKRMKVSTMMDEVLTDVLSASGIGISKICYEAITEEVELPSTDLTQTPAPIAAGLIASQAVEMQKVDRPIYESYEWHRISPNKFLWPADWHGSDWDEAPWLGFEFRLPWAVAKKRYKLSDDVKNKGCKRDEWLSKQNEGDPAGVQDDMVRGWEIWYRACHFDESVKHPKKLRRLILLDGVEQPVEHRDSPYQKDDGGRVTGVLRYPIRVLTLTYVSDAAIPPADAAITRPQVNELMRARSQMTQQRERSVPIRWFDVNMLDDEAQELIKAGRIQDWIPTNGPGDRAVGEIAKANFPREDFEFNRIVEQDLQEAWSMGSNQLGTETSGETTAEEVRAMQNSIGTRLDYERAKVLRYFVEGSEIVFSLIQQFQTDEEWILVNGEDGTQRFASWDKTKIPGEYLFDAKPDAALRLDVAKERNDSRNLYSFLAKEPNVNRQKLLESVLRTHGLDPALILAQPPPAKPEAPNVSYRFSGEDLSPIKVMTDGRIVPNPAFPIVTSILNTTGVPIDPKLMQLAMQLASNAQAVPPLPQPPAETEHGGMAERQHSLSKHHEDGKGVV